MHRLATGVGSEDEQVVLIEQTPAPLVVLTAADTEVQSLSAAMAGLPPDFPGVRVASLLALQQQITIDTYAEQVLAHSQVVVVRLLGGRAYWSYGLEVLRTLAEERGMALIILPGDDQPDLDLMEHSTVPLAAVDRVWRYFKAGGPINLGRALQTVSDICLGSAFAPGPPIEIPQVGLYEWTEPVVLSAQAPVVGVLFYKAHLLSANTAVIDALCVELCHRGLRPRPVYVYSLKQTDAQAVLEQELTGCDLIVNTTSFSLARLETTRPEVGLWERLGVPVLQAVLAGSTREQWEADTRGLMPRDVAMNIALPEVDGRIISRAISFKAMSLRDERIEAEVLTYRPEPDRIAWVAELAEHWVRLGRTPASERRVALVLANYPNRDGRLANGVGLDTPASCVEVLKALEQAGYDTGCDLPADSDALIVCLSAGVTNDSEGFDSRPLAQWVEIEAYRGYFATLSGAVRTRVEARWGAAPGEYGLRPEGLPVSGVRFGNVFVAIQPARGFDSDPQLNYHAPDLEPPHPYFAFYYWLREVWGAHAVVHLGKHGNLEWLPGKANALSADCFPEAVLGPLPHLYPFIVNDPGEGTQAKRRTAAVILDHLTPPMARAETYGPLLDLENAIDEYHEAASLDPARLPALQTRLLALIGKTELHRDLGLSRPPTDLLPAFLTSVDGYLCEIKEMQIRDGLHIFGQAPEGEQLCGLLVALARPGSPSGPGITQALALDLGLDFDPLVAELGEPYIGPVLDLIGPCRTVGDVVEGLERFAHRLMTEPGDLSGLPRTQEVLNWVTGSLLTALMQTDDEMVHLLAGLDGRFVPAGPSGAPTRGRPEVLPTGRNFYSVDVRAIPTPGAWDVGRKAAEALVERYTQEHGEYPRSLGLSVWGTSTMRTGGDDLAEALALIGVQPVWDRASRRVTGFEVIPIAVLGRPRVDVTLRISGFFRDAFANLIGLFDDAVRAVAKCDEADQDNPLRAQVEVDRQFWVAEGLPAEEAEVHSRLRIFGSKPGAYGAGLQGLIESRAWQDDSDLARAYLNWSGYAYTRASEAGISAPAAFARRLGHLAVVLHNQDNREHDLLDSDDYYQFQGGMTAAVRSLSGRQPVTYFGDHSRPQAPKVRSLHEEVSRVYRARVVNPKWIRGMMRHGYKGAFELSATVDYLFAYDATAQCVEDFMYQGVAENYLFDPEVQQFVRRKNPWVLRDMAERLLEAHQRGLWSTPTSQTLDTLRGLMLEAEAWIETHNDGTMPHP